MTIPRESLILQLRQVLKRPPGRQTRFIAITWLILLFPLTFYLYRNSLHFGMLSDATYHLERVSHGLAKAVSWIGTYHFNPVLDFILFLQFELFGVNATLYQITNIAQHALVICIVVVFAYELTRSKPVAISASIIFVTASSYYEATLWSIVGTYYIFTSALCLIVMTSFSVYLRTNKNIYAWIVSIGASMAVFSHEMALSLLPALIGLYMLVGMNLLTHATSFAALFKSEYRRRLIRALFLPGIAYIAFLVLKVFMAQQTEILSGPAFFPQGLNTFMRGLISTISFRSKLDFLLSVVGLGGPNWSISAWWIILGILLIVLLIKIFDPIERFLLLWITGHLLMMALAIGVVSRHLYLPTTLSSVLVAKLIFRFSEWISKHVHQRSGGRIHTQIVLVPASLLLLLILIIPPRSDFLHAQEIWNRASALNQGLISAIEETAREREIATDLYIANPVGQMIEDGYYAWLHWNGLPQLIDLYFPERFKRVNIVYTIEVPRMVAGGQRLSQQNFEIITRNESNLAVQYNALSMDVHVFSPSLDALPPSYVVISAETAPLLEWELGAWPYLLIPPKRNLDLQFERSFQGAHWVSLFYLSQSNVVFAVSVDGEVIAQFATPSSSTPLWKTENFPLPIDLLDETFVVTIQNIGEENVLLGRASMFAPQTIYVKETSPYLNWQEGAWPWFPISPGEVLILPMPGIPAAGGFISAYLAHEHGREIKIEINGSSIVVGNASPDEKIVWRTLEFPLPDPTTELILIKIEGIGSIPSMIARIELIQNAAAPPQTD